MALTRSVEDFVDEVGGVEAGPVCVRGGATQWEVGGPSLPGTRELRAPSGIIAYQPAEMTVRVGAGTTLAELHEVLAEHRQTTALGGAGTATVGGVLAVGRNSVDAPRHGPVRDALLAARYASADGRLIAAGGPTVKNVTGFDLCRLLVGSLGTLGLVAEVTLRTRPLPEASAWLQGTTDPFALRDRLYRPSALLWDGTTTWVHLEGHAADVAEQLAICASAGCTPGASPPPCGAGFAAVAPAELRALVPALLAAAAAGSAVLAEVCTGVVHLDPAAYRPGGAWHAVRPAPPARSAAAVALHDRLRHEFDPTRRCNPGRDPLAVLGG